MMNIIYMLIVILLLNASPLNAYTEQEIQILIKQNEKVQQLDQALNILYAILKDFSTPEQKESLKKEQREWMKKRNEATKEDAITEFYESRISTLKEHISEKEAPILKHIITDQNNIDREKALAALKGCPTLSCQAYTLYLEAQRLSTENEKKEYIKRNLLKLLSKYEEKRTPEPKLSDDVFLDLLPYTAAFVPNDVTGYLEVNAPLWLVLDHPSLLNYDTGTCYNPYGVYVIAATSIEKLPSYDLFAKTLDDLFVSNWKEGTIGRTFYSGQKRMRDFLSFAPEELDINKKVKPSSSFALINDSLERWSFLGPWNRKKHEDFKIAFKKMAKELQTYYESNDRLKKYAPSATTYLNAYVHFNYSCPIEVASEKAFHIFSTPSQSLEELKKQVKDFSKEDWNVALSYAILNYYGRDVLEWLIASGADVNARIDEESILIKAADHPDILTFLISKGANIESKTDFGKTVLFYAIQFNNLESVKVLVEKGANLNTFLAKNENKEESWRYHDVKKVVGFTPLAYSVRYGSEDMTTYLVAHKATLKDISMDTLKDWLNDDDSYLGEEKIKKRFELQKTLIQPSHKKK